MNSKKGTATTNLVARSRWSGTSWRGGFGSAFRAWAFICKTRSQLFCSKITAPNNYSNYSQSIILMHGFFVPLFFTLRISCRRILVLSLRGRGMCLLDVCMKYFHFPRQFQPIRKNLMPLSKACHTLIFERDRLALGLFIRYRVPLKSSS